MSLLLLLLFTNFNCVLASTEILIDGEKPLIALIKTRNFFAFSINPVRLDKINAAADLVIEELLKSFKDVEIVAGRIPANETAGESFTRHYLEIFKTKIALSSDT